jgi:integrase
MWSQPVEGKKGKKYRFFERFRDPVTGKVKTVSVTLDKDTTVSRKKARELLAAKAPGAFAAADLTLSQVMELYITAQKRELKVSTTARNARQMKALARILGGSTPIGNITAGYINQCFAASGEDNGRLNERLTRLKAMLRWAYENDYVADISYLQKLKPRPTSKRRERSAEKYLEAEELAAVLKAMAECPKWRLVTLFLCLSGLRIGELIALTDADVGQEYIHVSKTYAFENGWVQSAKTDASVRDVFIQPELAACIKDLRILVRFEKLRLGYQSHLFIPDEDGGFLRYDSYRQYFGDVTERTIERRLTPHACRHTMTSLMAGAGVPLETIARRLGHEDSAVTRKIYFHITERLKERDNALLARVSVF